MRASGAVTEPAAAAFSGGKVAGGAQTGPQGGAAPDADDGGAVELVVEDLLKQEELNGNSSNKW